MSTNNENTSEEIDLGQLFKLIGDGFRKIFQFIDKVFRGLFHLLIVSLQFIRNHFIKFAIAGFVGLGIGWYLDSNSELVYRSTMIVQPNFRSTQQLYNNIKFYNQLALQGEYKPLANALKISDNRASAITGIQIESFSDKNQKVKHFSDFIQSLDSTSRNIVEYEDYLENFNNINAKFHKITIQAKIPEVAKKCQNAIVRSIENNDYFRVQKSTNELNLRFRDSVVRKQLAEVDSLKAFYQNLKMLEAQKLDRTGATNINLSSENQNLDRSEIKLLSEARVLNNEILVINQRKADTENIINVISDFPNKGAIMNEFFKQKKVLLPIYLVVLTFVCLVLVSINRYLKNYQSMG